MILRSMSWDDLRLAVSGRLPTFHGFIWQPRGEEDRALAATLAEDYTAWTYFNFLNMPCPEWHARWLDFIRDTVGMLKNSEGIPAVYPWFTCEAGVRRGIMDWVHMDSGKQMSLRAVMEELTIGRPMCDVFTIEPLEWMFDREGAPYESFPIKDWLYWRRRTHRFATDLLPTVGDSTGTSSKVEPALLNSFDWDFLKGSAPNPNKPRYFLEHAQRRWNRALDLWGREGEVLCVDPQYNWALESVVQLNQQYPERWVSFSGPNDDACAEAYEYIAASL